MLRTLEELVQSMYKVAGKDDEALELTRHLERHAIPGFWNKAKTLPKKDQIVDFSDKEMSGDDFPLMLVDSSVVGDRHDPVFWMMEGVNQATEESCPMAFLDGRECHADWVGFKAISDYAFMREQIQVNDATIAIAHGLQDMDATRIRLRLQPILDHLQLRRRRLLFRLLNDRLKGRIAMRAEALKSMNKAEAPKVANRIARDVGDLLAHSWPDAASNDEQRARTEVVQLACMGAIQFKLTDVTHLTPC